MTIRTSFKAHVAYPNRNEALRVRSTVKAGVSNPNHNELSRVGSSVKDWATSFFVLLLLVSASPVFAQSRVPPQNDLLQGTYSFVAHGTWLDAPYTVSGVLTADGAGGITAGSATFVWGGNAASYSLLTDRANTYVVNSDGTGTLRMHFPTTKGFGLKFAIAVNESGRRIYLNAIALTSPWTFEDTPGPTATGEAAKQQ